MRNPIRSFQDLVVTNRLTAALRCDSETVGSAFEAPSELVPACKKPRQVFGAHYSYVQPDKPPNPVLLSFQKQFASELGLVQTPELVSILTGTIPFPHSNSWSLNYGGHQFGHWAGQLGDGRAISLAQTVSNKTGLIAEIQLKGAGLTPYSRFADGFAVVRSSIREYLCAEAMNALGVPTSRSLSIVTTDQQVEREEMEKGAIVARVAPSWIRFGSFEILFARDEIEQLTELADYCIENHFPSISLLDEKKYQKFLEQVVISTAEMIAHWQAVGFCHGVMNTDNFSILGLTIDYGPFQFLDAYDPFYICNHSDETGRYAFSEQPGIGLWNLIRLTTALSPLLKREMVKEESIQELVKPILDRYVPILRSKYNQLMCQKLGFPSGRDQIMEQVVQPLLVLMQEAEMDYTLFLRHLSTMDMVSPELSPAELAKWKSFSYLGKEDWAELDKQSDKLSDSLGQWYKTYKEALGIETAIQDQQRRERMTKVNPKYTLRNYFVQQVIEKVGRGDREAVDRYLNVLLNPFDDTNPEADKEFGGMIPQPARDIKCSCSS